jgi:PAS domain S-box-containing protein
LPVDAGIVLESLAEGLFTVDQDYTITSFNRAAEVITGVARQDAIGRPCHEVMQMDLCDHACALHEAQESGAPVTCCRAHRTGPDGKRSTLTVSSNWMKDDDGNVIGGIETFQTVPDRRRSDPGEESQCHGIISRSESMRRLFRILRDVAESESTILVEGPSGSGKELVARAIHRLSRRSRGPWVAVNCGALPDTLLESELFGHVRGAFTDAKSDHQGRFAAAEGGTIFLDEIGDISPALQVRLLRVLQERMYEPVGSSRPRRANVRVIAATNRTLRKEVDAGRFRADLFYRLNVMRLEIPPLSERSEDVPLLIDHFIGRFNEARGKSVEGVSEEAMAALIRHQWPGNIRELENAVEHAFILCHDPLIQLEHLPPEITGAAGPGTSEAGARRTENLRHNEEKIILETLERHGWRRMETARALGINKTTLWRKMKRLGIETAE